MDRRSDAGFYCSDNDSHYVETWHAMEKLVVGCARAVAATLTAALRHQDAGLCKHIGISNFNKRQVRVCVCVQIHACGTPSVSKQTLT